MKQVHDDNVQPSGCGSGCGGCGSHSSGENHGGGGCASGQCGGCSSASSGCCGSQREEPLYISTEEEEMLQHFAQCPFLPIAQFRLHPSGEGEIMTLEPVFLLTGKETLDIIKERGQTLLLLEEKGILSLDYEQALQEDDYRFFRESVAFRLLVQTVSEGRETGSFLYELPTVTLGSIGLTPLGDLVIEQLDFL